MALEYQDIWANYINVHLQPNLKSNPNEEKLEPTLLAGEVNKIWNKYGRLKMGGFRF